MSNLELYIESPLVSSTPLTQVLGKPVFLKLEAVQPSGSFKNRGIGNLCQEFKKQGKTLFVSSSGGNAGLAVAYAGKVLGVRVKVIIPKTTPSLMREKIIAEGAEVVIHGENWNEADLLARELSLKSEAAYISPFEHPLIWQGHSTMMLELQKSGFKPGAILLSVGGGGLYCGVVTGLKKLGWNDVPIVTAETEGAASFYQAVQSGKWIELEKVNTIATSLGAKKVTEQAFSLSKEHPTLPQAVTDAESLDACFRFLNDHRILVEPSCGATLSLIYQKRSVLKNYESILAIICGGNAVNFSLLKQWSDKLGVQFNACVESF